MAFIKLKSDKPGIIGLLETFPEPAEYLGTLAEHILRSDKYSMPPWVREAIAGFVSKTNNTAFCEHSHTAAGIALSVKEGLDEAATEKEMKKYEPLFRLAGVVTKFKENPESHITRAIEAGFTEEDVHLTVLIAAAFSMFNRYVDGLGTDYSHEFEDYAETGARLALHGYLPPKVAVSKDIPVEEHNV